MHTLIIAYEIPVLAWFCVFLLLIQYRAVMDSAKQAPVVPFHPHLTHFEVTQQSFIMDQDVVLTMMQVLRLRNTVQKQKKRAMRRMWTKSLYAQRGQKGAFHCVLDDPYKLHDAEKLQII